VVGDGRTHCHQEYVTKLILGWVHIYGAESGLVIQAIIEVNPLVPEVVGAGEVRQFNFEHITVEAPQEVITICGAVFEGSADKVLVH
jgi:hypothetical protein